LNDGTAAFLDTTIIVELVIQEHDDDRMHGIENATSAASRLVSSTYSRTEFKRVVLRNLSLALRYIEEDGFAGAYRRATKLFSPRRRDTLANILCWVWSSVDKEGNEFTEDSSIDVELSRRGATFIRNAIPALWRQFDRMVDKVADATRCQRATEKPILDPKTGTYDLRINERKCREGKCNNADFLNSQMPLVRQLMDRLREMERSGVEITAEIKKCLAALEEAMLKPTYLHDYDNCLAVGDLWIHLECVHEKIATFITTNYKESRVLCPVLGLEMVVPGAVADYASRPPAADL
jgi:predicted nucleic acid-binding protein